MPVAADGLGGFQVMGPPEGLTQPRLLNPHHLGPWQAVLPLPRLLIVAGITFPEAVLPIAGTHQMRNILITVQF